MKRLQNFLMALAMTVVAMPAVASSPEVNEVNVASKTQRQVSFPFGLITPVRVVLSTQRTF